MKAVLTVENPDAVEFSLQITMTLHEWVEVAKDLTHPSLHGKGSDFVNKLEQRLGAFLQMVEFGPVEP